jgi:very-short-patch-repair endonuclease
MTSRKPPLPANLLELARRLRSDQTDAEERLWRLLRGRQLGGFKFRRQHPLGPYVADFFCFEAGLVIELDGGGHAEEEQRTHDLVRDDALRSQGLRVVRVTNKDVLTRTEVVLQAIWDALPHSPSP